MVDLMKTKMHGDKLAEFLAMWDNVMIHTDESIVDADQDVMLTRDRDDRLEVKNSQQRICRCFNPYQPGRRPDGFFDLGRIAEMHERNFQAGCPRSDLPEQTQGATVYIRR